MSGRDVDMADVAAVIARIAEIAEAFGAQAGVGAMETAGGIISYLAEHPRDIEPCLRFGIFELPSDWLERGGLTWHAQNGKVVHPAEARRSRIIRRLERSATA
jgi:hypothetical protein